MAFLEHIISLSDEVVTQRLESVTSFLKEIDNIVDFNRLKPIIIKNGIGTKNVCGEKSYDPVVMFKILLLQKYYNLSDERAENEIKVNLLYMRFVGLWLNDNTPDSTTIGRFRRSLQKHKLYDLLFEAVNKQLEEKGFIVSGGKDVLIDATLTKSLNNKIKNKDEETLLATKKKIEADNKAIEALIEEELEKEKPSAKTISRLLKKKAHNSKTLKNEELDAIQKRDTKDIKTSKEIIEKETDSYDHKNKIDKDVRTGYQAGKHQYDTGFKHTIATDANSGAILEVVTTFANTADISVVDTMIEKLGDNIKSLGADKAYKSEAVDKLLECKKIENNVCKKETPKMTKEEKSKHREEEKPKHKIRAKVEHSFALIKNTMQQGTTRFIGLLRNNLNFTIVCIAANLKLFAHKQMKLQKVGKRWEK